MSRILIVDDEASICWAMRESLTDEGHHVEVASSAEEGLRLAGLGQVDALLLDVRLPGMDGLTAMKAFRDLIGLAPIVIMTAFGNLETAVLAMESNAFDYLVKPFDLDQATTVINRALKSQVAATGDLAEKPMGSDVLVGGSVAMQELFKKIALVAPTDVPVLITGESGTGKELVARAIHRHSGRRDKPFLPICPAALSPGLVEGELFGHVKGSFTGANSDRKGLLELASGGTVLLDEVGDIPLNLQVKLLRAIEHREVTPVGDARPRPTDIRIIAATNQRLNELMRLGQFREDLFFRLNVFHIELPPLRGRPDDIPILARHFLRQCRFSHGIQAEITPEAIEELTRRPWTGNVRELRNAIEHAAVVSRGQPIRPEHLPTVRPNLAGPSATPSSLASLQDVCEAWVEAESLSTEPGHLHERFLDAMEPPLLRAVIARCQGNRAAAAQMLGMHRATLRQKLRKYGLD